MGEEGKEKGKKGGKGKEKEEMEGKEKGRVATGRYVLLHIGAHTLILLRRCVAVEWLDKLTCNHSAVT